MKLWKGILIAIVFAVSACSGGGSNDPADSVQPEEDVVAGDAEPGETECTPDCTASDCGDDGCGGSCGLCEQGQTCAAGVCTGGCVPECEGKDCGDDGCGASCGECAVGQTCENGLCLDGPCTPACEGKECGDDGCEGTCGDCGPDADCVDGLCEGCEPDCEGKECGTDGCDADCGECDAGEACTAEGICEPSGELSCAGFCGAGGPDGNEDGDPDCFCDEECFGFGDCCEDICGACPDLGGCCPPDCEGKECGDDGCGGVCGECDAGDACNDDGLCEPVTELTCAGLCGDSGPDLDGDGEADCWCNESCFTYEDCCEDICDTCPELEGCCVPNCEGKECGDDGCGGSCAECPAEQPDCVEGVCTCVPSCENVKCGDDGCGGDCGACDGDLQCLEGLCVPEAGTIIITEFIKNPDAVEDDFGEWFELYNAGAQDVDLWGWTVKDADTDSFVLNSDEPLVIAAGDFLVIGRSADEAVNGGLDNVAFAWAGEMNLANGEDEIILEVGDLIMDAVYYNDDDYPDTAGASASLDPTAFATDYNDLGASWCNGVDVYGNGDLGTPGQANPSCGLLGAGDDCYFTDVECGPASSCWYNAEGTEMVCHQDLQAGDECGWGLGGCAPGFTCYYTSELEESLGCLSDVAAGEGCGSGLGLCAGDLICLYVDETYTVAECTPADLQAGEGCGLAEGACEESLDCIYDDDSQASATCLPKQEEGQPCNDFGLGLCEDNAGCNFTDDTLATVLCYGDLNEGEACGEYGMGFCGDKLGCMYTDDTLTDAVCLTAYLLGQECGAGVGSCYLNLYCEADAPDSVTGTCQWDECAILELYGDGFCDQDCPFTDPDCG